MPLVNISIVKGKPPGYAKAIADGVNSAVIETMGFPEDDRYQIITEHEPHALEYQTRTAERVMMFLIMRSGRAPEAKRAFYLRTLILHGRGLATTGASNHEAPWVR